MLREILVKEKDSLTSSLFPGSVLPAPGTDQFTQRLSEAGDRNQASMIRVSVGN